MVSVFVDERVYYERMCDIRVRVRGKEDVGVTVGITTRRTLSLSKSKNRIDVEKIR